MDNIYFADDNNDDQSNDAPLESQDEVFAATAAVNEDGKCVTEPVLQDNLRANAQNVTAILSSFYRDELAALFSSLSLDIDDLNGPGGLLVAFSGAILADATIYIGRQVCTCLHEFLKKKVQEFRGQPPAEDSSSTPDAPDGDLLVTVEGFPTDQSAPCTCSCTCHDQHATENGESIQPMDNLGTPASCTAPTLLLDGVDSIEGVAPLSMSTPLIAPTIVKPKWTPHPNSGVILKRRQGLEESFDKHSLSCIKEESSGKVDSGVGESDDSKEKVAPDNENAPTCVTDACNPFLALSQPAPANLILFDPSVNAPTSAPVRQRYLDSTAIFSNTPDPTTAGASFAPDIPGKR